MDDQPTQLPDDAAPPDLHIEVTPLSPSPATPGGQPALTRRKLAWRVAVISGAIVIALAVIFSGYFPTRTPLTGWALPQPTATNTPEPTPVLFGKAPTNCPPGNPMTTFSSSFGPGVGVADLRIWFVGFNGPQATARLTNAPMTLYGWPFKVVLAAAPNVTQAITLSADVMFNTVGSVSFSQDFMDNVSVHLILNPEATPPQPDGWRSWTLYMYLPASGCYYLRIEYGGQERPGTFFSAGT